MIIADAASTSAARKRGKGDDLNNRHGCIRTNRIGEDSAAE